MKLVLVTESYPPETRSVSHLMFELAVTLRERGHGVTVITTWPDYNIDQKKVQWNISEKNVEKGITVIRVKTKPRNNVNFYLRGISELVMPFKFLWKIYRHKIHADVIVIYSPPLPLTLVGYWMGRSGAHSILNIQDLFPQNAIDLGILTNPLQILFFRALENFAYRTADVVTVHSEGNQRMVLKNYPNLASKIRILHNWVDVIHHESNVPHTDFRAKWGIRQKYVAIFAGVMGPSQYLELILFVAEQMQDMSELLFLLVGDGREKEKLENLALEKSLSNVRFKGFVSREAYPNLLSICSIGLVCLSPQNKTPVVPGKILGYMAAGLPIVAYLQSSSDGHSIIKSAQCGISVDSADKAACVQAMRQFMQHKKSFKKIGQSGRIYAKENFSKEVCVSQLESMFELNAK